MVSEKCAVLMAHPVHVSKAINDTKSSECDEVPGSSVIWRKAGPLQPAQSY